MPKDLLPYRYSITCNGAVIRDGDCALYTNPISWELLLRGLDVLREYDVLIELFTEDGVIMERKVLDDLNRYGYIVPTIAKGDDLIHGNPQMFCKQ